MGDKWTTAEWPEQKEGDSGGKHGDAVGPGLAGAQPFLVLQVFVLLLGLQYVSWGIRIALGQGGPTETAAVTALKAEIGALKQEAKQYNSPATFVQLSKVQRAILKKEKALEALIGADAAVGMAAEPSQTQLWRQLLKPLTGFLGELMLSTGLVYWYWSTCVVLILSICSGPSSLTLPCHSPVLVLPANWLLPVGLWSRVFYGEGMLKLGVVLWSVVCGRVVRRVFAAIHPDAKPGFDFASLRKSVIGF